MTNIEKRQKFASRAKRTPNYIKNFSEDLKKVKDLEGIKKKSEKGLAFFYPEYNGAKGFLGNKDVCFISSRPSMNEFPPKSIKESSQVKNLIKFLGLLKDYRFTNAHLTDIIKTRSDAGFKISDLPEEELTLNLEILKRELEILKLKDLKLIAPISEQVEKFLRKDSIAQKILGKTLKQFKFTKLKFIKHYSWAYLYNKPAELEKDLKKLRIELNQIKYKKQNFRLLIVDDDHFVRVMYKNKSGKMGFDIFVLPDAGGQFIQKVLKIKPDLISLDIVMPNRDGYQAIKLLKQDKRTKQIPVFFLTNLSGKENRETGLKLGAVDYLVNSKASPEEVLKKYWNYLAENLK